MHRFALTIGMLLLLSGAYFPYAWGVGLLIHSGSAPVAVDANVEAIPVHNVVREPIENERVARQYFPGQDWMLDAKIQLHSGGNERHEPSATKSYDDGELFCYSTKFEQTDSKTEIRFEPFALVTFSKEGPLSVLAQSAVVKFEREIDIASPAIGRIVEARLEGEVVIRGANNLNVSGRHFVYSAESARIWSDQPVKFAFDQHSGESDYGIQLDLVMADIATKKKALPIEDVRSVHLMRHVVMNLAMPEGDGSQVTPVRIECHGSFQLDRRDAGQTAFAVFDRQVSVKRLSETGKVDSLDGQTLEVTFARDMSAQSAGNNEGQPTAARNVKFKPTLLVVRGAPAIFRSEDKDAHGRMGYARYDAVQRMLALSSSSNNPSQLRRVAQTETSPVHLRLANSELESQQIGLKHDANNRVQEVVCRGAGWLKRHTVEDGEEELSVTWKDQLRKYQDANSPLDVIDVTGNVVVEQPKQDARFTAGYIKLWMDPLNVASSPSRKNAESQSTQASMNPRRLLAVQNVTMTSPRLNGTAHELQVWFENVDIRAKPMKGSQPQLLDLSMGKSRIQPVAASEPFPIFDDEEPASEQAPAVVDAKLIRALIVGRGPSRAPDLAEIYSEGHVSLTQPREDAPRPLTIKAEQMHLRNQGLNRQEVHLVGEPAKLDDPQLDLQGREVFFDRHRNLVWVDGQGELKLPVPRDLEGKPLANPAKLTITWNEQMVFDGLVATFTGRVIAGMFDSTMKCQKMEVRMQRRMKFERDSGAVGKTEISTIVCRQQVEFDSSAILNSSLNQVRKGRFAAFAMNVQTGRAEAKGPGILQVWRRGQGKIAGLAPQAIAAPNQATRVKSGGWDYTQIEFADELIGLREQRSTTCKGQVQVVYGPVSEPLEMFDVDRLPKDAFLVSSDSLQVTQPQHRPETGKEMIELVAEGNAWLEGRAFSGQADVISYDSANDLFMLRSLGENDSELTHEQRSGGNRIPTVAKTIQFVRSQNVVNVDKVRFSSGLR